MKPYLLMLCLLLGSCTSLPQTMKGHMKDIPYAEVNGKVNHSSNVPVRLGGIIVDVVNEESFSLVQVLFHPLNYFGRPQLYKPAEGRFFIKSTEFFDPLVYTNNTEITVVGTLNGDIERKIGKRIIQIPLILSKNIYLWPKYHHERSEYHNDDSWDWADVQ